MTLPKPKKKKPEDQSNVRKNSTPIVQLMPIPSKVMSNFFAVLYSVSRCAILQKKKISFSTDAEREALPFRESSVATHDQNGIAERRYAADKFVVPVDWTRCSSTRCEQCDNKCAYLVRKFGKVFLFIMKVGRRRSSSRCLLIFPLVSTQCPHETRRFCL